MFTLSNCNFLQNNRSVCEWFRRNEQIQLNPADFCQPTMPLSFTKQQCTLWKFSIYVKSKTIGNSAIVSQTVPTFLKTVTPKLWSFSFCHRPGANFIVTIMVHNIKSRPSVKFIQLSPNYLTRDKLISHSTCSNKVALKIPLTATLL